MDVGGCDFAMRMTVPADRRLGHSFSGDTTSSHTQREDRIHGEQALTLVLLIRRKEQMLWNVSYA